MSISVKFQLQASRPVLADGVTPNPLWAYIIEAQSWGVPPLRQEGEFVYLRGLKNTNLFTIDLMKSIIGASTSLWGPGSVDVLNYPAWLQLTDAAAILPVPAYVPVPDVIVTPAEYDENGVETVAAITRRPNYNELRQAQQRNGTWYAACSDGNKYFDASVQVQLDAETGVTLISSPPAVSEPV